MWFGTTLPHSLINPNQLRAFGHVVNDDPTDTTRLFGISTGDGDKIPFEMMGTIAYFETQVPSPKQIAYCRCIYLTDDTIWDPLNIDFSSS